MDNVPNNPLRKKESVHRVIGVLNENGIEILYYIMVIRSVAPNGQVIRCAAQIGLKRVSHQNPGHGPHSKSIEEIHRRMLFRSRFAKRTPYALDIENLNERVRVNQFGIDFGEFDAPSFEDAGNHHEAQKDEKYNDGRPSSGALHIAFQWFANGSYWSL